IGFTPCFLVSLTSSTAPASEPWSVSATAGISSSAARAASAGIRHAPSRIENSEWTWRWTKGVVSGTGKPSYKGVPTWPFPRRNVGLAPMRRLLLLGILVVLAAPGGSQAASGCTGLTGSFKSVPNSAGAGNIVYTLRLHKTGTGACLLQGLPKVRLLGTGGKPLPTKVL